MGWFSDAVSSVSTGASDIASGNVGAGVQQIANPLQSGSFANQSLNGLGTNQTLENIGGQARDNANTNGFGGSGGSFDPQNLVNNMYNSINQTLTNFGLPKDQVGATVTNDLGNIADFITGVSQQKNQAWQNQVAADAAAQQATNLANQNTQNQQTDLAESNAAGALRSQTQSQGSGPVLATNGNGVATYMPSSASSAAQRDFLGLS